MPRDGSTAHVKGPPRTARRRFCCVSLITVTKCCGTEMQSLVPTGAQETPPLNTGQRKRTKATSSLHFPGSLRHKGW